VGFAEDLEQIFVLADHPELPVDGDNFDDIFGSTLDLPRKGCSLKLEQDSISFESQAEFLAMLNSL
jgi:hypothetical protein